jgi:hypothetical protein
MDDDKKSGGKIEGERSKAWRLWRVSGIDSHKIQLVAEADTQEELYRKHKRRLDWHYKTYHNGTARHRGLIASGSRYAVETSVISPPVGRQSVTLPPRARGFLGLYRADLGSIH